jgi:hypothetical protein
MVQADGANHIKIDAGAGKIFLNGRTDMAGALHLGGNAVRMGGGNIHNANYLELNESASGDSPAASRVLIFKETGTHQVRIKFSDGSTYRLNRTAV